MLVSLSHIGALDVASIATYSLSIIPVSIGVWFGSKVHQYLSDWHFRQAVMLSIITLGDFLILR